jgi:hypothetical protein
LSSKIQANGEAILIYLSIAARSENRIEFIFSFLSLSVSAIFTEAIAKEVKNVDTNTLFITYLE